MSGVTARQVRLRLNNAFEMLGKSDVSKLHKMQELWAILSDIQLWMEDRETDDAQTTFRGERLELEK